MTASNNSTAIDATRAFANIALAVAQPLAAYAAELRGRGTGEVERARRVAGLVTPADGTFAIWAPLFLSSLVFALRSGTNDLRNDHALRRVGWMVTAAFASNVAWSLHVQRRGLDRASLGLIGAAASSAVAATVSAESHVARAARSGGRAPGAELAARTVAPLAGWLTLAAAANLEATSNREHGRPPARAEAQRAVNLIGAATILASGVEVASRGNLGYASAVAWGLSGVLLRNVRARERRVASAAAAGLVTLGAVTWFIRRSRRS